MGTAAKKKGSAQLQTLGWVRAMQVFCHMLIFLSPLGAGD